LRIVLLEFVWSFGIETHPGAGSWQVGEDSRYAMTIALIRPPATARHALRRSDDELARAAGAGDVAAFEALYERHHLALLSFARHMLGRVHDAEDVVQHTFLAADAAFRERRVPASVRAWLYTVARNRCISILRARRDDQTLDDPGVPSAENLAEEVEQREDLRDLLGDLRRLPDDQRAALLLAELGELSHREVAQVLGVRSRKVKALVYQARQALMAAARARAIPCRSIREELAVATGSARRRRHLRDHVTRCDGCRAYAAGVDRQRASLAAILPVVPTVALRDGVLACLGGSGAVAATGGAGAGLGVLGAKLLAIAAVGGAAAGGGTVAVTELDRSAPEPRAARQVPAAPAAEPVATAPERALAVRARSAAPRDAGRTPARRAAPRAGTRSSPPAARARARAEPSAPPGLALGRAEREARGNSAGGSAPAKPQAAAAKPQAPRQPAGPPAAMPARAVPAAPGLAGKPEPPARAQRKVTELEEPQLKAK
jgi:RNA polymerase sigma factor (sigma-70 family)